MECSNCSVMKSTRANRPMKETNLKQETEPLQLLFSDVVGPIHNPSFGGCHYFATLIDDSSGYSMLRCMPTKNGGSDALKEMITGMIISNSYKGRNFSL